MATGKLRSLDAQADKTGHTAQQLKQNMLGLKTVLAGMGLGLLAKDFLDVGDSAQKARLALETLTKGQGDEWFERINAWAKDMPLNTQAAVDAFVMLQSYGIQPTIDQMTTLVDSTIGIGKGEQAMESIARAMGQIQSRGKLLGDELNQLAEAGLNAREMLADAFQVSSAELEEMIKQGLSAQEVIPALFEQMEARFGGSAQAMQDQFSGLRDGLISIWTDFERMAMESGGMAAIEEQLRSLRGWATQLQEDGTLEEWARGVAQSIDSAVGAIAWGAENIEALSTALAAGGAAWGVWKLETVLAEVEAAKMLAKVRELWGVVSAHPFALAVAGAGALVTGLVVLGDAIETDSQRLQRLTQETAEAAAASGKAARELADLEQAAADYERRLEEANGDRALEREALEHLHQIMPELVGDYDDVKEAISRVSGVLREYLALKRQEAREKEAERLRAEQAALAETRRQVSDLRDEWALWIQEQGRHPEAEAALTALAGRANELLLQYRSLGEAKATAPELAAGLEQAQAAIVALLQDMAQGARLLSDAPAQALAKIEEIRRAAQGVRQEVEAPPSVAEVLAAYEQIRSEAEKLGAAAAKAGEEQAGAARKVAQEIYALTHHEHQAKLRELENWKLELKLAGKWTEDHERLHAAKRAQIEEEHTKKVQAETAKRLAAEHKRRKEDLAAEQAHAKERARIQEALTALMTTVALAGMGDQERALAQLEQRYQGYYQELEDLAAADYDVGVRYEELRTRIAEAHQVERTRLLEEQHRQRLEAERGILEQVLAAYQDTDALILESAKQTFQGVVDTGSNVLVDGMLGNFDQLGDDFADLGESLLRTWANMLMQMVAAWSLSGIADLFNFNIGLGGGESGSTSILSGLGDLAGGLDISSILDDAGTWFSGLGIENDAYAASQWGAAGEFGSAANLGWSAAAGTAGTIAAQLAGPAIFEGYDSTMGGLGSAGAALLAGAFATGPAAPFIIGAAALAGGLGAGGLFASDDEQVRQERMERAARIQAQLQEMMAGKDAVDSETWLGLVGQAQETDAWMLDRDQVEAMRRALVAQGRLDWWAPGVGRRGAAGDLDQRGWMENSVFGGDEEGYEGGFGLARWFGGSGQGAWGGEGNWERVKEYFSGLDDTNLDALGQSLSDVQAVTDALGLDLAEVVDGFTLAELATGQWTEGLTAANLIQEAYSNNLAEGASLLEASQAAFGQTLHAIGQAESFAAAQGEGLIDSLRRYSGEMHDAEEMQARFAELQEQLAGAYDMSDEELEPLIQEYQSLYKTLYPTEALFSSLNTALTTLNLILPPIAEMLGVDLGSALDQARDKTGGLTDALDGATDAAGGGLADTLAGLRDQVQGSDDQLADLIATLGGEQGLSPTMQDLITLIAQQEGVLDQLESLGGEAEDSRGLVAGLASALEGIPDRIDSHVYTHYHEVSDGGGDDGGEVPEAHTGGLITAHGVRVPTFHDGGPVTDWLGPLTWDEVPAIVKVGEWVTREQSVTPRTLPILEAINRHGDAALGGGPAPVIQVQSLLTVEGNYYASPADDEDLVRKLDARLADLAAGRFGGA